VIGQELRILPLVVLELALSELPILEVSLYVFPLFLFTPADILAECDVVHKLHQNLQSNRYKHRVSRRRGGTKLNIIDDGIGRLDVRMDATSPGWTELVTLSICLSIGLLMYGIEERVGTYCYA
jgi:hypothetical protein